jgi:Fur family transcriptional regulator, ferric uptake regulator
VDATAGELVDALRRAGLRITAPRRAVCGVLADATEDHLTPKEILERLRERGLGSVDPSTVYRTLDTLSQVGLVHHVHLGHGAGVVHLSGGVEHQHLVCEVCGRVEDIPIDELRPMLAHLESRYGFVADGLHFALSGRCARHVE